MPKYRCVVATPTKELFSGEVDYARVPGHGGYYGVLSGHESFVGLNRDGFLELWLDPEGNEKRTFLISKGCTQVFHDHLSVLPRYGIEAKDINLDDLRTDIDDIKTKIEETKREDTKVGASRLAVLEPLLMWYETQVRSKEREIM